jgi:hypothetical protein
VWWHGRDLHVVDRAVAGRTVGSDADQAGAAGLPIVDEHLGAAVEGDVTPVTRDRRHQAGAEVTQFTGLEILDEDVVDGIEVVRHQVRRQGYEGDDPPVAGKCRSAARPVRRVGASSASAGLLPMKASPSASTVLLVTIVFDRKKLSLVE